MHPARSGVSSHEKRAFAHPARATRALGIEPGMKVADFGAGSGAYVLAIAQELLGSGAVYAIDIQKDLLRRIKNEADARGFKNVEVIWADLEEKGASKLASKLDLVLISNLLFQVHDKRAVVAEATHILRDGGRLAIIDWSESYGGMGPIKEHVVTKEDAYELARTEGLLFVK